MNNKTIGALSYLVFFAPKFYGKKSDPFLAYHSKQGLGLLIYALALQGVISIIGYWGGPQYALAWVLRFFLVYMVYVGASRALRGETLPLPYIGKYVERGL